MGFNHYLLLALFPFCSTKDTMPTFLIDYDQVMDHLFIEQNPFARTSVSKFADIIEDAVTQSAIIIIFVEERLCTEDISIKDERGTPFQNLHEELMTYKVKYMPNVVSPVKLLTRLLEPTDFNVVVLSPGQIFEPIASTRFFYVFFRDYKNETRVNVLRRHDKVMQDVYETTRKIANGAVIAFYTGKVNPVMFSTFEYGPTDVLIGEDPNDITMASHAAMLRFKGLSIDEGIAPTRRSARFLEETPLILRNQIQKESTVTQVAVGMYYMEFFFNFTKDNWILDIIKLYREEEVVGQILDLQITVPYGRSYYCDEPLIFYNMVDKSNVVIPEYQVQPFREEDFPSLEDNETQSNATDATRRAASTDTGSSLDNATDTSDDNETVRYVEFGYPIRCTNYFNIGILTGLSVFALFLSVLMLAIFGLYHVETNNRFDDPYGKQFYTTTIE